MSMELLVASGIGWVTACGIYLLLRGRSFDVVLGLVLLGYAVNVFIFAMGRLWRDAPPIMGAGATVADPLPQALVLTAIVIGFATTGFVIELALRSRHESGTDHVDGARRGVVAGEPSQDGPGAVAKGGGDSRGGADGNGDGDGVAAGAGDRDADGAGAGAAGTDVSPGREGGR